MTVKGKGLPQTRETRACTVIESQLCCLIILSKGKMARQTKACVCYDCSGKLRPHKSGVPPAPFDFVLTTKEYRSWYDKEAEKLKVSKKLESTYYHVNLV
jgi:hypothetical protein